MEACGPCAAPCRSLPPLRCGESNERLLSDHPAPMPLRAHHHHPPCAAIMWLVPSPQAAPFIASHTRLPAPTTPKPSRPRRSSRRGAAAVGAGLVSCAACRPAAMVAAGWVQWAVSELTAALPPPSAAAGAHPSLLTAAAHPQRPSAAPGTHPRPRQAAARARRAALLCPRPQACRPDSSEAVLHAQGWELSAVGHTLFGCLRPPTTIASGRPPASHQRAICAPSFACSKGRKRGRAAAAAQHIMEGRAALKRARRELERRR